MSYLIDTCALSELVSARPSKNVISWIESVPQESLFVSVLSIGEIRRGVEKLAHGRRHSQILNWLEHELPQWFGDRMLAIDVQIADEWGRLQSRVERTLPAIDSLIAATSLFHRLTVVTRNVKDFELPEIEVLNPWDKD